MDKGYIELKLNGIQGAKTKVNLWVHAGCMQDLGEALQKPLPQLFCGRIRKWRPDGKRRCLVCDRVIAKNKQAVAWMFDNSKDDIKTVKSVVFHENCRQKLADGLIDPNL